MKGLEFLRRVQRLGRRKGIPTRFEAHQGKGSQSGGAKTSRAQGRQGGKLRRSAMYMRVHEHSEWFSNDAFPSAVVLASSDGRLWFGDRWTTLKDRRKEIGKGLIKAMCKQLGIDPDEL